MCDQTPPEGRDVTCLQLSRNGLRLTTYGERPRVVGTWVTQR